MLGAVVTSLLEGQGALMLTYPIGMQDPFYTLHQMDIVGSGTNIV